MATHVVAFSGGKDSTALLLWLRERGVEFTAVFCDTGWEHPLTHAYIEEINRTVLGGHLVTVRNPRWTDGMRSLVEKRGRVPSIRARFCTEELKVFPMRDYLRDLEGTVTVYMGLRAEESPARAAKPVREWSDMYDAWVEYPLLHWTAAEVFACLDAHGVAANPLYRLGSKRVGCFPCVLTGHAELRRFTETMPEVWDRIAELEVASGRSFFPPSYIPERYNTGHDARSGKSFPTSDDVRRYVIGASADQLALYGETPACLSVYNLCE